MVYFYVRLLHKYIHSTNASIEHPHIVPMRKLSLSKEHGGYSHPSRADASSKSSSGAFEALLTSEAAALIASARLEEVTALVPMVGWGGMKSTISGTVV